MTPPGITRYAGGYDYYCDKIKAESAPPAKIQRSAPLTSKPASAQKEQVTKKSFKIRRDLQKDMKHIEKRIKEYEQSRDQLLKDLTKETADYKEINKNLAAVQQKICDYTYRWVVLLVVLPFFFIWALFFSYDMRNLTLALPLIGCPVRLLII